MEQRRACIHEAGHFLCAFKYRPVTAHSILMNREVKRDSVSGKPYVSLGGTTTVDPPERQPQVLVSIRAAGLAAESLIYDESYEDLMASPATHERIATDIQNAKRDLEKHQLLFASSSHDELLFFWRIGFDNARVMLDSSQDRLERIADHLLANPGREVMRAAIVDKCCL